MRVVVAHAFFARGHEPLRFVGPQNQQVCIFPLRFRSVESAEDVGVKEHFQAGVHVPAFGLELLRHGDADDLAAVDLVELEGVRFGTENLCDLRREEILEIVGDGLANAAKLLGRLVEIAVLEVVDQAAAALGGIAVSEVAERFVHVALVEQETVNVLQCHVRLDFVEGVESLARCASAPGF